MPATGDDTSGSAPTLAVRVDRVSKAFPGVQALREVSLDLAEGEVHGLVGENGAGKSTLIKLIAGADAPDAGTISAFDQLLPPGDPRAAAGAGVATIYQELTTVPDMSAVANVFLGRPRRRYGFLTPGAMRRRFAELGQQVGVEIDPDVRAGSLSVALRQMLEIMRALEAGRRILIMDEPTAALGPHEREKLYATVRTLTTTGHSVIYISHDLDEVLALADRVTVMRDGSVVEGRLSSDWSAEALVGAMLGRQLSQVEPGASTRTDVEALRVDRLCLPGLLHDVALDVRQGEILGIAGLVGSGRSETLRALAGAEAAATGRMSVLGRDVPWPHSVVAALGHGIALAPEDRKAQGLVLGLDGARNVVLSDLGAVATGGGWLARRRMRRAAADATANLGFDAHRLPVPAGTLSGGNQQKLVIGKWLHRRPRVLLLDEPTRGIDIGAKAEIYEHVRRLAAEGVAIIVVSSELEEVVALADRCVVMAAGRTIATLDRAETSVERILALVFRVQSAA